MSTIAITNSGTVTLAGPTDAVSVQNNGTGGVDAPLAVTLAMPSTDQMTLTGLTGTNPDFDPNGDGGSVDTVNIGAGAAWVGTFALQPTEDIHWIYGGNDLTVTGGAGSTFDNNGTSVVGDSAVIDVPVTGTGTFAFATWAMSPTLSLEFGQVSVAAGQSVNIGQQGADSMTLDDPQAFAGAVTFGSGSAEIDLKGLPGATSYTDISGMLTIYDGNTPIDGLRLTAPGGIQLQASGSDVFVLDASSTSTLGTVLPDPPTPPQFVPPPTSAGDNSPSAEIYRLYQAAFMRPPDPAGDAGWVGALENGSMSLLQIASAFVGSAEFKADYAGLSVNDFVVKLSHNALGRAPDPAGEAAWDNALTHGMSKAQVLLDFSNSAENRMNVAAHTS